MILGGKITLEEYEDWKANWPDSTKKDYVPNIINKKHISYDEYLAEIQARNEIAESAKKRYQDFYTRPIGFQKEKIVTKKEAISFYTYKLPYFFDKIYNFDHKEPVQVLLHFSNYNKLIYSAGISSLSQVVSFPL